MKKMKNSVSTVMLMMLVLLAVSCAAPQSAEKKPEAAAEIVDANRPPTTLAILPFENNSVTDPEKYAPLGKGLSAMLITDLKQAGTSLKLIERAQIANLLKEIALSQSGSVSQSTAIEAGRILGAQSIAFGSFMVIGNDVRIDTRIVKVETSELIMAESIVGKSDDFIGLEKGLARQMAASLQVAIAPQKAGQSDINAALYFSQGLEALDRGDRVKAQQMFDKAIQMDPAYGEQVAQIMK